MVYRPLRVCRRATRLVAVANLLAVILAGLIPGGLPGALVRTVLPAPAADVVAANLPAPAVAQAATGLAAPLAQAVSGSNVLTITKTVVGTGNGPFNLTVTGPNGYLNNTTVSPGTPTVLNNLAAGIYTVTESTPTGWTTVYTATPGTGGSTNAVVTLQNSFAPTAFGPTAITGRVYNDNNSDGNITANGTINDTGVQGVTVTVYDNAGNAVATVTDANGLYTVTPGFSGPYRVEFTNLPFGYEPSRVSTGTQNGTTTQFVTSAAQATGVNLGIARPDGYLTGALNVATTSQIAGDPLGAGTPSADVAHLFSANASGTAAPTQLATNIQIGSVWGLAWQRSTNRLYTSAMVKRHAGLGSLGLGGIYVISNPQGTPSVSTFVDLESAPFNINLGSLGSNSARGLPTTPTSPSQDATAFGAVGKQGLGDIDLTEDEQYLYAVDLYNRALLRMNVANGVTPTSVQSYALGNELTGAPSCTNGVLRPWGLRFFNGRGYLGTVCTGELYSQTTGEEQTIARSSLVAYVLSFDPNAPGALTTELSLPLIYTKGQATASSPSSWALITGVWYAWTDTYASSSYGLWRWNTITVTLPSGASLTSPAAVSRPAPILADIDFTANGNMVLGFRDRGGDMMGSGNLPPDTNSYLVDYRLGGDVLCAAQSGGVWVVESSGSCGGVIGSRTVTTTVSGALNPPEFYDDDILVSISASQAHRETSQGGLAARTDVNELLLTVMDPTALWTGGVRALNSQTGANLRNYQIYLGRNGNFGGSSDANGRFGKAGGMGDMELLYALAPTEIGNRVWNDINGNGIQDPGEPGLNGLTVTLQTGATTQTTTTAGDGNYYFTVAPNTAYTIRVNTPAGYNLTTTDANSVTSNHTINDGRDSDATLVGGVPTINYTTGSAGQNNHGLDFGFTQPVSGRVGIVNTAPGAIQVSKQVATTDGSSSTVAGSFTVNVNCGGVNVSPSSSQTVAAGGSVTFSNIPAGNTCTVGENTLNLPAAPSGYTWVNSQVTPSSVTVGAGTTSNVTVRNTLAPLPTPPSSVLTVTKTISGTGSGPFNITVTGPNGYSNNSTINPGTPVVLTGLVRGVYTVTESSPGAGWTTVYTATPGTGGSTNAVVTLENSNSATLAATAITGRVFRDFNSDGQITANGVVTDTGVSGVTITAYDKNGNSVGSATSDATGNCTLNPSGAGPYRVEFSNLPSGYEPTTHGTGNGTSTQFVTTAAGASNVNLGINVPEDYSQTNPRLVIAVHTAGAITPTNTVTPALYSFSYGAPQTGDGTGIPNRLQSGSGVENPTPDAQQGQIGATWGLGYDRAHKRLFASTVLKRQVGLGPLGLGGIYVVDYSSGSGSYAGSFNLQGVTPANGGSAIDLGSVTRVIVTGTNTTATANGLNNDPVNPSKDIDAFAKVGKVGFGDIDIDTTREVLWAVNLNQSALISIDVHSYTPATNGAVPGTVNQYLLSTLSGVPTCTNGVFRPWALKLYHGAGYLGGVCSAENAAASGTYGSTDISFHVLRFDPTNPTAGFTSVATAANYNRAEDGSLFYKWCDDGQANASQAACNYQQNGAAFRNVPQPIFADIEFREDGSLLGGIADRYTMQQMTRNYDARAGTGTLLSTKSNGDLLFWCKVGSGYVAEGGVSCPVSDPTTAPDAKLTANPPTWLTTDGLSGAGEFFHDDWFVNNPSATLLQPVAHNETSTGGLTVLPGAQRVLSTAYDPVRYVDTDPGGGFGTQGVRWFNTQTGGLALAYQLMDYPFNTFNTPPHFAKGNGLGDLELLADPAPLEIGNRVWNDLDGDGVQDAGEPGLSGVQVSLQGPTTTVTVNTDADGLYYFNNLRPYTAYTLTVNVPGGYSLTAANQAALSGAGVSSNHAISDTLDSDAALISGKATIYYSTGSAGQNNHGLDFGFTQPVSGRVDIVNTAPLLPSYTVRKTLMTPDPVRVGDDITFTIAITNTGSTLITTLPLRDLYATGSLLFLAATPAPSDNISDGQLDWSDLTVSFGQDLAPGQSLAVTTVFVARSDTTLLPGGATVNMAQVLVTPTQTVTAPVRIEAPTAVTLADATARYTLDQGVTLRWATADEANLVGFHLLRRELGSAAGWVRLNSELLPAQQAGQASGASYTFSDPNVQFGHTYLYLLEVVDNNGTTSRRELGLVVAGSRLLLPLVVR